MVDEFASRQNDLASFNISRFGLYSLKQGTLLFKAHLLTSCVLSEWLVVSRKPYTFLDKQERSWTV
jgi:hypothetical protein